MSQTSISPEEAILQVIDYCADCDTCRLLMDEDCLFFPELYRLFDQQMQTGRQISTDELKALVNLCNFCGLCPCPNIRAGILDAKSRFMARDGLQFGVRLIEDVQRIGKWCGAFPRLANRVFQGKTAGGLIKEALGIHRQRLMPQIPRENFPKWVKARGKRVKSTQNAKRKVAYFAGCTANYFFPEVARSVVEVFEKNGIEVFIPDQKCCAMPSFLEGDRDLTLKLARHNVTRLASAVQEGYDVVCSCPTCGYMLKNILVEGAFYSEEYQKAAGADERFMKVPRKTANQENFTLLHKSVYGKILKDDGYFSPISAMDRIAVAQNTYDAGEYFLDLHRSGYLETDFSPVSVRMLYFAPCHLREQNIGRPYMDLMKQIPDISLEMIDDNLYCCGMAGVMGFKKDFHDSSIRLGGKLMARLRQLNPEKIATDCLSCRLQFNQLLSCEVVHPMQILNASCKCGQVM